MMFAHHLGIKKTTMLLIPRFKEPRNMWHADRQNPVQMWRTREQHYQPSVADGLLSAWYSPLVISIQGAHVHIALIGRHKEEVVAVCVGYPHYPTLWEAAIGSDDSSFIAVRDSLSKDHDIIHISSWNEDDKRKTHPNKPLVLGVGWSLVWCGKGIDRSVSGAISLEKALGDLRTSIR